MHFDKIKEFGQVFTKDDEVQFMLNLRQNFGRVLEPFAGNGAFSSKLPGCVSLEFDSDVCPQGTLNIDFFDYPVSEKFETIITNPPYVQGKRIVPSTRAKIQSSLPGKTNLYIFCIEKMLNHLADGGELILLNPLDFLRTTSSSIALNKRLLAEGAITHLYDVSGQNIFVNANPDSCCVWRYVKGQKQGLVETETGQRELIEHNGRIFLVPTGSDFSVPFDELFYVKVGAVSGQGEKFFDENGTQFVFSKTVSTGGTRGMDYQPGAWIRNKPSQEDRDQPRVYVNCKTLHPQPFFVHQCKDWDGSILAIFPKNPVANVADIVREFNLVDWDSLGFRWHSKFVFTSGSLTNCLLPTSFNKFR